MVGLRKREKRFWGCLWPSLARPFLSLTDSHGCESQCFGGHCGSLGHGGFGSWVTVWWSIGFVICDGWVL